MECIALYITPTIQEFLTEKFISKAKLLQHNILHIQFVLRYVLTDVTKNIIQQFIDYYFSDAVKKAYYIISNGRRLNFRIATVNKRNILINDDNYLFYIKLLTKKYQDTYHFGNIILDDAHGNRLSIITHKQTCYQYNNLLEYFKKGSVVWVELNNDNAESFLS